MQIQPTGSLLHALSVLPTQGASNLLLMRRGQSAGRCLPSARREPAADGQPCILPRSAEPPFSGPSGWRSGRRKVEALPALVIWM